jgi:NAD+ kinase
MKIAIFGNVFRPIIHDHVKILIEYFKDKDVDLLLDKELYEYVKQGKECCLDNVQMIVSDDFSADLALSIGGDGTFLNTAKFVGVKQIPILGINTGRLGFLADVSSDEISHALNAVLNNQYRIEERTLLQVKISEGEDFSYPFALNEVAILKQDGSSMITVNASVNGQMIHSYQSDGLLVATPTGSTAYSMSVGGPIVVPQAASILLSPIASHSLNVRPLIIPDNWIIDLEVHSRSHSFMVAIDGRSRVLPQTTKIRITKANHTVWLVKELKHTFFDTLKNKLMWGVDKRN